MNARPALRLAAVMAAMATLVAAPAAPAAQATETGMAALMGARAEGMPLGITFIGKPGEDAQLLGYAYAFEQTTRLRPEPALPLR